MRLFMSKTSPYVRKVMMLADEAGILDQLELLPAGGNPVAPGTMPVDYNPLGKIPCLLTDNGDALVDSRVICRYLDTKSGAGLYPEGEALWSVLTLEALSDGTLDAAILIVYEARIRPDGLQYAEWTEGQWQKIARTLDALDTKGHKAMHGPLNAGQIALGCALGYLDFRHPDRDWRRGRAKLAAWYDHFAERPSFQATIPQG